MMGERLQMGQECGTITSKRLAILVGLDVIELRIPYRNPPRSGARTRQ